MAEIKLRASQERLERLSIGVYRRANRGDIDAMVQMLAHFMIDERGYMEQIAAEAELDALSFGELREAIDGLSATMQNTAAPKASGTPSPN